MHSLRYPPPSPVKHRQLEPCQPLRIGDGVDGDDLPVPDREVERPSSGDHVAPPPRRQCRLPAPAALPARGHASPAAPPPRRRGPPAAHPRDGHRVRTKDDIRVEDRQQALKVATSRGGQEGVDRRSLPVEVGVARLRDFLSALRVGSPALTFTRARSVHAAAGAAGELPRRGRRPPHDRRDLVEGDGKHVVQDERQPLGWLQHLQND